MTSMNIRYVLFDLDGTLADTAPDLVDTLNQVLAENGCPTLTFDEIRPTVSHGGVYMLKAAFKLTDDAPQLGPLRDRFLQIYDSRLCNKTRMFQGMADVLDQFEAWNIPWGIVTNKSERLTLPLMRKLNLDKRTQCIVAGDTVEYNKPHPAPMLHACRLLDCEPSETLYVGDAKRDIQAGQNSGMHTLIAGYGYIGENDKPETWGADGLVNSPLDILQWISATENIF